MDKPRVGIVSSDYDGTLASYFDLRTDHGVQKFHEDMQIFRNQLYLVKVFEKLDKVYFSLNTMENKLPMLSIALASILGEDDWLQAGPQFCGGDVARYDTETKQLVPLTPEQMEEGYKFGRKLENLSLFALKKSEEEEVVSVTHIEDGKDYTYCQLEDLKHAGIETHIINLPGQSTRAVMLEAFQDSVAARQVETLGTPKTM
jgi:hypothetical protein